MPFFYKEHFKINSKVRYIKELYDSEFRMVRDLLYNNGNFISLENIETILGKKYNFLVCYGLLKQFKRL